MQRLPLVGAVSRWQAAAAVLVAAGAAIVVVPKAAPLLERVHRLLVAEAPRLVYAASPENEELLARCEAISAYWLFRIRWR